MIRNQIKFSLTSLYGLTFLFFICFSALGQLKMPACSSSAEFYKGDSINVVTFGASTVEGIPAPFNFQQPLKSFIENCYIGKSVNIYNYGIAGETTSQGLARFDSAIAGKTGFVMLLMGVNDALQMASGNGGSVEATTSNMRKMIEKAQRAKMAVIVGTLQAFLEPVGKGPQLNRIRKINSIINDINIAYKALAASKGLKVADINSVMKKTHLYADEVHPNKRGYYVMAMIWFDAFNQEIVANHLKATVIQNYPNPADTFTRIGFTLSSASEVKVSIFNVYGQSLGVVFEDYKNAGYHVEEISTTRYSPGVYVLYFEFLNRKFTKKMIVVH
ncbi:GDSL-type esterase/lipase family protein [Pedobacter nyackensis]|uniref:GDSL-type esterase/lipase family protein n=1 Tax=Pedobacter nyackensis TaxID=475255 RepID=UPI00292FDA54|nr:GDSL-type esterase/lipase family protein [Pedobacter nyackensis]